MPAIPALEICDRNSSFGYGRKSGIPMHHRPVGAGAEKGKLPIIDSSESNLWAISQTAASFLSHDLRHLLSAIYCNVEFMSDPDICQEDREQFHADVCDTIRDMTDLLDAYLLSIRTGKSLDSQPCSLNLLIERTVNTVRSHPDARGVELVAPDGPLVDVRIDSKKLGAALYNLLLNACQALKCCPFSGVVRTSLGHDESFIVIRVEDNGHGIPDFVRDRFSKPFVSVEKMSCFGLGLSIAEQAAREHGGALCLEESSSGGTVFTLCLPRFAIEARVMGEP